MAFTPLVDIKNWFRTGLKPTQDQFWRTWDSFWHKGEKLPKSAVEGLEDTLGGLATKTYVDNAVQNIYTAGLSQPAWQMVNPGGSLPVLWNLVTRIVVQEHGMVRNGFKIGTTAGGSEIWEGTIDAGKPLILRYDVYFGALPGQIYFSGFSQFTYVQIWYT